jgi:hypothetical protein
MNLHYSMPFMRIKQSQRHFLFPYHRAALFVPTLILLLSGCANLPDTQPFTDATVTLRGAVASGGAAVVGELERTEIQGVKEQAKNLETAWNERNKLLTALVEYANSIQSIVDSGKRGAESANALAASVSKLAKVANLVEPGAGEAVALITDTAAFVYEHIAKARAAASLEKALAEVQPAIERIALTMAGQMQLLDDLIRTACKAQRDELRITNQAKIGYRNSLAAAHEHLMDKLRAELDSGKKPSELTQAEDLQRLDDLLAATDSWFGPLQEQVNAIGERERLSRQLITETKSAFADWGAAHARMLTAIRTKRIPSATELVQAAERIRELVERFKKL